MEIYLAFWDLLGADLVEVLNSCYRWGRLSPSQRSGVISLSFKKGDRLDPKNWRPISLLGVDYKIASRAIAGRLLKVIEHVVAPEQTCGVPGRYIGENAAFLRDVVTYATSSGTPVAILSHDQEKAFDRGDWSFLHGTLQHMAFGPSFTRWFNIFYTDVRSAVKANGHISQFFHLSRGVWQGCPPSPLLYVLYAEVLACTIRANPTIKGVQLPGTASALPVLSQYGDDTSLYGRISPSGRRFLLILYSRVAPDRKSTRPNPKVSGLGPGAVGLTPRWRSSGLRTNSSPWASTWGRETLRRRTGVHVFQPWKTSYGLGVSATSLWKVGRLSSAPWPWHVSGTWPPLSTCQSRSCLSWISSSSGFSGRGNQTESLVPRWFSHFLWRIWCCFHPAHGLVPACPVDHAVC